VDAPKNKIIEFNNENKLLNDKEIDLLGSLGELLKVKQQYHSSKVSKQGFELIRKLFTFPMH